MAQRIGTSHFVSLRHAVAYYSYYAAYGAKGADRLAVKEKVARGEISIGRPEGRNVTADRDGRYWRDF